MNRFQVFNPEPSKWSHDKRIYERAIQGIDALVAKNFSKYAIPCIGIYPDMDPKTGKYRGYKVAAPEGPLKTHFEKEDVKAVFFNLLRDATIDAVAKKNDKLAGKEVAASCSVIETVTLSKPPRPVWTCTVDELDTYFTSMKTELARKEGIKLKPKWPKIVNGVTVTHPTPIPCFDEVMERILPSAIYIPKKRFPLANHHWRLKLACAYLLSKCGFDSNSYALDIPSDYKPKQFSQEAFEKMSRNIAASAATHDRRNNQQDEDVLEESEEDLVEDGLEPEHDTADEREELYTPDLPERFDEGGQGGEQDAGHEELCNPDLPESFDEDGQGGKQDAGDEELYIPDLPERFEEEEIGPTSVPGTSRQFDIFNNSHETGTPLNSSNGDDDEEAFLEDLENEMNEFEDYIDLLRETDIRSLLSGEKGQPILQLYNFKKVDKAKCFKADAHDGKVATTKITFSANVNEEVEEVKGRMPVIKVTDFILFNGSFLFIKDFEVIKILDYIIAKVDYLEKKDYEELKALSMPNPNLPQTPTVVKKKLT